MVHWYQQLVENEGEEVARAKMREIRAKVNPRNIKGGSFRNPKLASQAGKIGGKVGRKARQTHNEDSQAVSRKNQSKG